MEESRICLSTNLFDMLIERITPETQPTFEYLGTHIPIVEDKTLEQNSMIATGEAGALFYKVFLGVLNQRIR